MRKLGKLEGAGWVRQLEMGVRKWGKWLLDNHDVGQRMVVDGEKRNIHKINF